MKKLILIFIAIIFSIEVYAESIKFMGQPLGCKYSIMKQHLLSKNFKFIKEAQPFIYEYKGIFGGDKVSVCVYTTPKSHLVSTIAICYDDFYARKSDKYKTRILFEKKESLVNSFKKIYGPPIFDNKELTTWTFPDNRISIMYCDYHPEIDSPIDLVIFYKDEKTLNLELQEKESDY